MVQQTKMANKKTNAEKRTLTKVLAIVRIRGEVGVTEKIETTLKLLRLHKKHRCVIVPANLNYTGMIRKVKDYCTFGEIDEETVKELLEKRGRIVGDKPLTTEFLKSQKFTYDMLAKKIIAGEMTIKELEGLKPFFKLHPPRGGYERGGIKKPYSMHGALGYRGDAINKLLRRMI
jgi:large subunit ribosomal protein L30